MVIVNKAGKASPGMNSKGWSPGFFCWRKGSLFKMYFRQLVFAGLSVGLFGVLFCPMAGAEAVRERIEQPVSQAITIRQKAQQDQTQWQSEQEQMLARYSNLEQEIARLQEQKHSLTETTAAARQRIAVKQKQLDDTTQIGSEIVPFIRTLVQEMQADMDKGLPFLMDERRARLERLTTLIADPEVAISEKFRKTMEALMIEAEYARTIEVYQQTIPIDSRDMQVNVFRLGRLSVFFQTLDRKICGWFNVATQKWESLPVRYNVAIHEAIEMGAKRQPVELLTLPIGRMAVQ